MSDNRTRRRIHFQQINHVRMGRVKNNSRNHNSKYTLHNIPQKHQEPRLRPEYPERIRGTRIAAPEISDINTVQSPIDIGCLKKPKHISDQ